MLTIGHITILHLLPICITYVMSSSFSSQKNIGMDLCGFLYIVINVMDCELVGWKVHDKASEYICFMSLLLVSFILLL